MDTPPEEILLVEGRTDEQVIRTLITEHALNASFVIQEKGGIDPLLKSIYAELNASGRRVLGIVADANDAPDKRWKSIVKELNRGGCSIKTTRSTQRTIFNGPRQGTKVGVWLMPDNKTPGELEDFVAEMIPKKDPVWPRAQKYIDGIPSAHRPFKDGKIRRAYVHAWLAARREPRTMGLAVAAGDLNKNAAVARRFIDWLDELYSRTP